MVIVRVCLKLKTSWKSIVFTNKVGKNLDILWAFLIKQLFHSRLLDMRWLLLIISPVITTVGLARVRQEQRVSHINRSNENMFRSHVITTFKATIPYKCS